MAKCTACGRFLSPTGAAACTHCPSRHHKGCAALSEHATPPKDWVCPECSKKRGKCDSGAHTSKGSYEGRPSQPSADITLTTTAPADNEVGVLRRDLAQYMAEQRDFREELRTSLANMGARMDGFERRLEALERVEAPADHPQMSELQHTISQLKQELNDRDQEALLTDLDIGLIPEQKGENVVHTVIVLAAKLGVALQDRDIVFAERVGPVQVDAGGANGEPRQSVQPRRVVVLLVRRDELLCAARVRRNITSADAGLPGPPRRVYINERLTKSNRLHFYLARAECTKRQWRFVWTKRGRIFVRQGEGKQVYIIRSNADLERVFSKANVGQRDQ